jgi:hypothetical protein
VKLAASDRPEVYRGRPNHEQAYWLARIREANNPERSLVAACAKRRLNLIQRVIGAVRPRVRMRTRLRSLGILPPAAPAPSLTAEERRLATRCLKGIDD